jgi:repressor LexA
MSLPEPDPILPVITTRAVRDFIKEHGWAPTYRELGLLIGITSLQTVQKRINRAVQFGYLERGGHQSRTLRVTKAGEKVCR